MNPQLPPEKAKEIAGYEPIKPSEVDENSQIVNGQWYRAIFGCDSLETALAQELQAEREELYNFPLMVVFSEHPGRSFNPKITLRINVHAKTLEEAINKAEKTTGKKDFEVSGIIKPALTERKA